MSEPGELKTSDESLVEVLRKNFVPTDDFPWNFAGLGRLIMEGGRRG